MLEDQLNTERVRAADTHHMQRSWSLQVFLWTIWTGAVIATGYLSWHADVLAQQPINTLGLAIHCVTMGLVGLVVLTRVEMWLEPWRFMDR